MKNYTYQTTTEILSIEIDPIWHGILAEEDKKENNDNRKHTRADHKYALGLPVSLELLYETGTDPIDIQNEISYTDLSMDLTNALDTLTDLQRLYFIMSRFEGYSNAEISRISGKTEGAIRKSLKSAEEKIKNFFL